MKISLINPLLLNLVLGILFWSCILPIANCQGQTNFVEPKQLFFKDHITFSIGSMLREAPSFVPLEGFTMNDIHPKIFMSRGIRLGYRYQVNLSRLAGIELGMFPTFYWSPVQNEPGGSLRHSFRWDGTSQLLELPVNGFLRFKAHPRIFVQPFAGLSPVAYKLRRSMSRASVLDTFLLDLHTNTGTKGWFYLYANVGVNTSIILGNEDMLVIGISGHFATRGYENPTTTYYYRYFDPQDNTLSSGNAFTRGNYISMDIGYTFTRTRELRRNMEVDKSLNFAR